MKSNNNFEIEFETCESGSDKSIKLHCMFESSDADWRKKQVMMMLRNIYLAQKQKQNIKGAQISSHLRRHTTTTEQTASFNIKKGFIARYLFLSQTDAFIAPSF